MDHRTPHQAYTLPKTLKHRVFEHMRLSLLQQLPARVADTCCLVGRKRVGSDGQLLTVCVWTCERTVYVCVDV